MQAVSHVQERLLTTEEASGLLGKNSAWLRTNRAELGIPAYKVGKQYRFKKSDNFYWLEKNASGSDI